MEKISLSIKNRFKKVQRKIESALDNDFHENNEEIQKIKANFETTREEHLIRSMWIGLPEEHVDKVMAVFSKLALFFDAGVLLENNDALWKPQALFHKGVVEILKTDRRKEIMLPDVQILNFMKSPSDQILKSIHLSYLDPEKQTQCLLIKVTPDFSFFLLSKLEDLWLKDHAQQIQTALERAFAD